MNAGESGVGANSDLTPRTPTTDKTDQGAIAEAMVAAFNHRRETEAKLREDRANRLAALREDKRQEAERRARIVERLAET